MFGLPHIRDGLQSLDPIRLQAATDLEGRASVAVIFAGPTDSPSLCFIRRAARENDHWSGHMAFPGGRAEPEDTTPRSIAERETIEEVGLALRNTDYIGPLSELWIRHSGIVTRQVLAPFVYYVGVDHLPLAESDEVAQCYWIPVEQLWVPSNWTTIEYERKGRNVILPAIRHDGQVIWGLTYMMLCAIGDLVNAPLPAPVPEKL